MPTLKFNPFPELTTTHLVLRKLITSDAPELYRLRTDEVVNKYIDRPETTSMEEVSQFIEKINEGISKGEWIYWAINKMYEQKLIGTICLWNIDAEKNVAEIGYELFPSCQGQGFMLEAVQKITRFGFENMHLEMITAWSRFDNKSSIKLLKKNNFTSIEKREQEIKNVPGNYVLYTLSRQMG